MRRLTAQERSALTYDASDDVCVPDSVFAELAELGYGRWVPESEDAAPAGEWAGVVWEVTAKGREAWRLDTLARAVERR